MRASNPHQPLPLCSLLDLRRGARAVVRGFEATAGSNDPDRERARGLAQRLVSMGLSIGAEAEVLVSRGRGPLLLRSRDARIALGRDEARCVRVERVEQQVGETTTEETAPGVATDRGHPELR